jgi:hypothetical protein
LQFATDYQHAYAANYALIIWKQVSILLHIRSANEKLLPTEFKKRKRKERTKTIEVGL